VLRPFVRSYLSAAFVGFTCCIPLSATVWLIRERQLFGGLNGALTFMIVSAALIGGPCGVALYSMAKRHAERS
jgi:hypothetical protein